MSINVSKLPVLFFSVLFLDQPTNPEYWKYPFTIFRFKHDHTPNNTPFRLHQLIIVVLLMNLD